VCGQALGAEANLSCGFRGWRRGLGALRSRGQLESLLKIDDLAFQCGDRRPVLRCRLRRDSNSLRDSLREMRAISDFRMDAMFGMAAIVPLFGREIGPADLDE